MSAEAHVLVERYGDRVDIVLNRPDRKNAITKELAEQLAAAIATTGGDSTVGAIVIRGAGGSFCSGMDLKAAGVDLSNEPAQAWFGVHAAIYRCRIPTVVALERFAINAGAALALAGSVAVAGESAFLQVSEVAMGVGAPMCQAWLHLRHSAAVGDRVSLLADRIGAAELLRLGLVTEVVPDDQVVGRAQELADRIAGCPPSGRRAIASIWKKLRGELEDPELWFASLGSNVRV